MSNFIQQRGPSLALVVLVLFVTALAQLGISYTLAAAEMRARLGINLSVLVVVGRFARFGLVALLAILWVLGACRTIPR